MDINEIERRLRNLLRKGVIADVTCKPPLCRVEIGEGDEQGIVTNWLPWFSQAAGTTLEWLPLTRGEQVMLLSPMGDHAQGVALRGIYSDTAPAPDASANTHTRLYPDGARICYDHAAHSLSAELPAGASVSIVAPASVDITTEDATVKAKSVKLDADDTTCLGRLTVKGALAFESGMTGRSGKDGGPVMRLVGSAIVTEKITAGQDVVAQNVSLVNHPHRAQGPDAITTKPISGGA